MDIISILHGCLALFLNVYGFVTQKNKWDYYYLLYIYTVAFSWTLFNGDCLITYYYNKHKDPSYQAGNFTEMSDLHLLFGKKYSPFLKRNHILIVSMLTILSTLSMYIVFRRQHFSLFSTLCMLGIYSIYYATIMNKINLHFLFFVLLLGCLFYILSVWK